MAGGEEGKRGGRQEAKKYQTASLRSVLMPSVTQGLTVIVTEDCATASNAEGFSYF